MRKILINHCRRNDKLHENCLVVLEEENNIFTGKSVDTRVLLQTRLMDVHMYPI